MKRFRTIILILVCAVIFIAAAIGISSLITQRGYLETIRYEWDSFLDAADRSWGNIKKLVGLVLHGEGAEDAENAAGDGPDAVEGDAAGNGSPDAGGEEQAELLTEFDYGLVPAWDGVTASVPINSNVPFFTEEEKSADLSYISYADLDEFGRCGETFSCLSYLLLPEEERDDEEERSVVIPTGYRQSRYPEELVDQEFLYNRCHLIAWQLGGDANSRNLITGTRYLNVEGMLPYENRTAQYLRNHQNRHVLYRVTPIFVGEELTCRGVLMEAYSVEDHGKLCFCAFVYNEQPGILIDHLDGSNSLKEND